MPGVIDGHERTTHEDAATVHLADVEPERIWLDDASWVDVTRGWLTGADEVFAATRDGVSWSQAKLFRYERYVEEPRLTAGASPARSPHPVLVEAQRRIQRRYRSPFDGFGLAWYRDGRDSVAFHRDRDMRWLDDTVIALLTLGATRPFLLRPRSHRNRHDLANHGATHDLAPAAGDLIVMGGATQRGWEHSVPKVRAPIGGRISAQWRWTSRRGRPEQGASYRAPRTFSR